MFSARIFDKLTESFTQTPFYKTEEEAKEQAIEKIKRLEKVRNAENCDRFEIDSITIK